MVRDMKTAHTIAGVAVWLARWCAGRLTCTDSSNDWFVDEQSTTLRHTLVPTRCFNAMNKNRYLLPLLSISGYTTPELTKQKMQVHT